MEKPENTHEDPAYSMELQCGEPPLPVKREQPRFFCGRCKCNVDHECKPAAERAEGE